MRLLVFAAAWSVTGCALDSSNPEISVDQPIVTRSVTSSDGYLTLTMSSTNQQDATGVTNTYTWTAHNTWTGPITGVTLGSHWGDYCGGSCTPAGPTQISIGPGCSGQGANEIPLDAHFGVWCTPTTGVTLASGASISGSATLRPGSGGPADYTTYSLYNDPITGVQKAPAAIIDSDVVAPAAVDEQLTGSASTGSPPVGANYTYNFQIKNAGPWGMYGGVTFTDTLPSSVTYVGYTASAGVTCSAVAQTVTCQIADRVNQNGQSSTISLTVRAPTTAQQIVNTASIAFAVPQTDSQLANNTLTITVASK